MRYRLHKSYMQYIAFLCYMKTNVMIRIEGDIANKARSAGLNISQVSEKALMAEINKLNQTFEIRPISVRIKPEPLYTIGPHCIFTRFRMNNYSNEDLLFDRITYTLTLELFDKEDESQKLLDTFSGTQADMFLFKKDSDSWVRTAHMVRESTIKIIDEMLKNKGTLKFNMDGEAFFQDASRNYFHVKFHEPEINIVNIPSSDYAHAREKLHLGGERNREE